MAMNVLCFGEVLWDHINGEYHLGGAPLNFAAHSARFGSGSYVISGVGRDDLGDKTLKEVKEVRVSTEFISRSDNPTGVVEVTMADGIPSYEIVTGTAWDSITPSEKQKTALFDRKWDLFYMGSLAQRSAENRTLLNDVLLPSIKAETVFFDVNLRQDYYSREVIEGSLEWTTILKLNDEELPVISQLLYSLDMAPESLYRRLREDYPSLKILILTKGPDGADIINDTGLVSFPIESDVTVVDTVGAGDSYSGSFCYAWLHTKNLELSAKFAQDVADRVVSQPGALPDYGEGILTRARDMAGL